MSTAKKALAAALLVAIALLAVLYLSDGAPWQPAPAGTARDAGADAASAAIAGTAPGAPGSADRGEATAAGSGQGVFGRTIDEQEQPVAGAQVFLFEARAGSPFEAAADAQRGLVEPPLASAVTDAGGGFRIGVGDGDTDLGLELRAVDGARGDAEPRALAVAPGVWLDLGDVLMPRGNAVQGTVRDAGSGAGIAGAVVTIRRPGLTRTAMPGREDGLAARTDGNGDYRFANATAGLFTFAAVAEGHARVELAQQHVFADQENRIDFELPPGTQIDGVVVDGDGRGIAGALVRAESLTLPDPTVVQARTDAGGGFRVSGLAAGDYRVGAGAAGFRTASVQPVQDGARGLRIVLAPQGGVRLRVVAGDGRPIERYTATARVVGGEPNAGVPGTGVPGSGAASGLRPRRVGPEDLQAGVYTFRGLDPGKYELEIAAAGHARTFSAAFAVTDAIALPEVTVVLHAGGTMRGMVRDAAGGPVAGAEVETLPADFADNAASALFRPLLVFRVTNARARTAGDGTFALHHLAAGDYQLRIDHPDFAPRFLTGLRVADDAATALGDIRLDLGTALSGTITVDDRPATRAVIEVTAAAGGDLPRGFALEAVADEQGRFQFARRLPPGSYRIAGGRRDSKDKFRESADLAQTRTEITLGAGEASRAVTLRIRGG